MKQKFEVTGMTCAACQANVEKSVCKLAGVDLVNVNLLSNSMVVEYDEAAVTEGTIIGAVKAAGYGAFVPGKEISVSTKKGNERMEEERRNMKFRLIVSFAFLVPLMYVSMGHMMGLPVPGILVGEENALIYSFTQLLLTLPVVYVNRKFYLVGFQALFHRMPNMDSLIAMGSSAALVYGCVAIYGIGYGLGHGDLELVHRYMHDLYFESAAMILALITLGKFLETRSKSKTSEAIEKLMDLAPKTALVEKNGAEVEIPLEEVAVGDIVIVKPGQNIPVDGILVEGTTSVDQSALTGESIPVEKKPGDPISAATMNKNGAIRFRATKVGDDTTLAQIIRLVEEAGSSKAPIAKLADKIAGIFVPVVIGIALAAVAVWLLAGETISFAVSIGISVLVISCPCALGLATPVAIMVGTGKGASHGILIHSAESLEVAHTIRTVVMDKTGTITEGKPVVTDILVCGPLSEEALLTAAAAIEKPSEHPLSEAIVRAAQEKGLSLLKAENFLAKPGYGIEAVLDGKRYCAGNQAGMEAWGIGTDRMGAEAEKLAEQGKTPLFFAREDELLGVIAVADVVKPTSRKAIEEFKAMGIEVVMLTGDNRKTAAAIGKELGIEHVIAEVIPQEKEKHVRELQEAGKRVAMIGDGINDAPALVRSDVGIAIGAGTDVAIESADIVLMKSDLLDAVTAIQLSRSTIRNIKENLFWAFFYNSVGIPLAAGVFYSALGWKLNPMFGAAAMSLSSVCVVSNALRLRNFKPKFVTGDKYPEKSVSGAASENIEKKEEKGENTIMTKTMKIQGMSCNHCKMSAEKALNAIDGIHAEVNLEKAEAVITYEKDVADDVLAAAITEAGFEPGTIA
ncbi:MAG: heavy metal translocating P-type ATPase [Lachnospiraceae bacterium]|nr:heavy metal translocating P-type ATPase [Lachnospiraceae bacterium]